MYPNLTVDLLPQLPATPNTAPTTTPTTNPPPIHPLRNAVTGTNTNTTPATKALPIHPLHDTVTIPNEKSQNQTKNAKTIKKNQTAVPATYFPCPTVTSTLRAPAPTATLQAPNSRLVNTNEKSTAPLLRNVFALYLGNNLPT